VIQFPPHGGPALRIANTIKVLAETSELTVACRESREAAGDSTVHFLQSRAARVRCIGQSLARGGRLGSLARRATRRIAGANWSIEKDTEILAFDKLLKLIRQTQPDLVWLGYGNISYPLLRHLKQHVEIPVVVDTDSVWSRFVLRGLPYAKSESERAKIQQEGLAKQQEESWGTAMADVTTAVSEVDAEYYRSLTDDPARIHLLSNVIDLDSYLRVPPPPPGYASHSIYLAGTFWHGSPMEHAARWTIDEVLPIVHRTHPETQLYIVGKDSDSVLADVDDARITIAGRVDSVLPYLCHARVAIVPLWFESGTRFKILEAGACGTPVVSTTLGAEGIPVRDGKELLIADTPQDFAAAIIQFLDHPVLARSTAQALGSLVASEFALPKLRAEAESILRYALLSSRERQR
jgi:glycosyltransferase involved in cell wall biosynthesis